MREQTVQELQKENAALRDANKRMEKALIEECRIIKLLVAAGLVDEDKVEVARELATALRG